MIPLQSPNTSYVNLPKNCLQTIFYFVVYVKEYKFEKGQNERFNKLTVQSLRGALKNHKTFFVDHKIFYRKISMWDSISSLEIAFEKLKRVLKNVVKRTGFLKIERLLRVDCTNFAKIYFPDLNRIVFCAYITTEIFR